MKLNITIPKTNGAPVAVTKFAAVPEVKAELVPAAEIPPMPAHIGQPVGAPPAEVVPKTFEEAIAVATSTGQVRMEYRALYAQVANAFAMERVANALDELLSMIAPTVEDGEEPEASVLSQVIADGIVMAAEHGKKSKKS